MVTKRIKIPDSIEKAEDRLAALDGIATATGWERAAIVYAFTYEGKPGPQEDRSGTGPIYTISAFCRLKITGLHRKETVINYRENWKAAIASGDAQEIGPGDSITLPTIDWPVTERNQGSRPTPSNIGKQMANDPALLQAAVDAAASIAPAVVAGQATKPAVASAAAKNPGIRRVIKKATKDAEADEQDERLQKAGISRKQRAARKQAIKDSVKAGTDAAAGEWEAEDPTYRGEVVLSNYAIAVFGAAETLEKFVSEPDNSDAVWGDPEHVAGVIDILDETIEKIENVKAMLDARIEVNALDDPSKFTA